MIRRLAAIALIMLPLCVRAAAIDDLKQGWSHPPESAKPWVYWVWMDANLSREGITADLEAMHRVGIGGVIIMEVDVGVPRGDVKFMSPAWQQMFKHVCDEAKRLGIVIDIIAGPGWTGSGGPWVKPEQSMQKVVSSEIQIDGGKRIEQVLPMPEVSHGFYRQIATVAFTTPSGNARISDIAEKALFRRGHYSSEGNVREFLAVPSGKEDVAKSEAIGEVIDLSPNLDNAGKLVWDAPPGKWTIIRFGRTSTGANTRPAPLPGLGLECDKLDKAALDAHFQDYFQKLIELSKPQADTAGLKMLHIDSWEMGSQNWTAKFRDEFVARRGYDPIKYLPAMTGRIVQSREVSERFLWDLRQTVLELVCENHAGHLKELAKRNGLELSIEPYDGTPVDDMVYGSRAEVPMCEFWSNCFDTNFSVTEATSIAHTHGRRIIAAEAFTADQNERWLFHPGSMKAQGDWAFCAGVNRFVFHRYAHQPWIDRYPGMTMGPYGVHYERTQTWWELSRGYHDYLSRCQFMLQQGVPVADICYLAPEASPQVFREPRSATKGNPPDRLGYNFDGCTAEALVERMSVKDGRLVMPDGMSWRVLVLPNTGRMTPRTMKKLVELVEAGGKIIGPRPTRSPSLSGYPQCDEQVMKLGDRIAGEFTNDASAVTDERNPLESAKWIWADEGNPAVAAPRGKRTFRKTLSITADTKMESALVTMTADNSFELYVNRQKAGAGDNFTRANAVDVAPMLRTGENQIEVIADNGGDQPNPAGLIGAIVVRFADGSVRDVVTDRSWESKTGDKWLAAKELGGMGMAPWGEIGRVTRREIYPSYKEVSGLLAKMDVPPDFEADKDVRYIHRSIGNVDVYFIASGASEPVSVNCTFRVAGRRPQIWDAVSGEFRACKFEESQGRTVATIELPASGSGFVVFPETSDSAMAETRSSPSAEIQGPWEVAFQQGRGAPAEKVAFEMLIDWSTHKDERIKFFSGVATYRKVIDVPAEIIARGSRLYLDLGDVHVMAGVKLNGNDVGVAWTPPFRVEITDAVTAGPNDVEIQVANLWVNRLIGDERLPEDCQWIPGGPLKQVPDWVTQGKPSPTGRITFTTWKFWGKDEKLVPSGLIGPVKLMAIERTRNDE